MKNTDESHPANEFGRYCVPAGLEGRPAARAVIPGRAHAPETLRFMRARPGDGDFLAALSSAMAERRRVWAFEPNPSSFYPARKSVALNGLRNVTLTNAALSNREGTLIFRSRDAEGPSLGGLSHVTGESGEDTDEVQAVTPDYVVPLSRRVTFLQLEAEGHEKPALRGACHRIHRWKPIPILGYLGQEQWIRRSFRGLGYRHVGKLHGNHVYACEDLEL
ncbi:MAG: FkbM family methyltransferase [Rhodobacteraceae bacterium]|nr:FkbM family methyltransferase [Paracoccaceae bacterium]